MVRKRSNALNCRRRDVLMFDSLEANRTLRRLRGYSSLNMNSCFAAALRAVDTVDSTTLSRAAQNDASFDRSKLASYCNKISLDRGDKSATVGTRVLRLRTLR